MKAVIQRVSRGKVTIDGEITGEIDRGYVVLLGVTHGDTEKNARYLANRTLNLRIFPDEDDKMNRSILDVSGKILVISQFTLYADCRKGRRPSFVHAAPPDLAAPLVDHFAGRLRQAGIRRVESGEFGALMLVEIHNDGPLTIVLDTDELKP